MNKLPQHNGELSPLLTCEDCTHSIRQKGRHDMVICVPHLKSMPTRNSSVCDLHLTKNGALTMGWAIIAQPAAR